VGEDSLGGQEEAIPLILRAVDSLPVLANAIAKLASPLTLLPHNGEGPSIKVCAWMTASLDIHALLKAPPFPCGAFSLSRSLGFLLPHGITTAEPSFTPRGQLGNHRS
jgi:hypothetical protein